MSSARVMVTRRNDLANASVRRRFLKWLKENVREEISLEGLDLEEFGDDLTYSEAIEVALHKFPALFREGVTRDYYQKVKQIVFVAPIVKKLINREVRVTYRKTPKHGFYYVIANRFKPELNPGIILEFYKSEMVDPSSLSDEDARLAGVETAEVIRGLFTKWYGSPIPPLYRNWFEVKSAP